MTDRITIRPLARVLALACVAAAVAACGPSPDHEADSEGHAQVESSSAGLPEGRVAAGEQLANAKGEATGQSCIDCHGVDGNAPIDPSYPKLGGQYADYLAHALQGYRSGDRNNALNAYRNGDREHPTMQAQAQSFSEADIADIAAFLSSLQP